MKVLALLNISNADDLQCDSGVIFQRILSDKFLDAGIDYKIIGPDIEGFRRFEGFKCEKLYTELGQDRYSSRFLFNWNALKKIILEEKPDIIFNNQAELGSAFKALITTLKLPNIKIVTYCHYPAIWSVAEDGVPEIDGSLNHNNLGLPIVFDILSSVTTSDSFVIQSNFAKDLLDRAAKHFNIPSFKNIEVISPPQDPTILEKDYKKNTESSNKNILYNHRLYASYGTQEFLDFIDNFNDKNYQFVFSDPMPNRSQRRSSLSGSPSFFRDTIGNIKNAILINGDQGRDAYKNTIQNSKISCGAFRKACVWSMSAIDCMSLGVPVIAKNFAAYPEFIPQELLFNTEQEGMELINHLMNDELYWQELSCKCVEYANKYSAEIISDKFIKLFKKVLDK